MLSIWYLIMCFLYEKQGHIQISKLHHLLVSLAEAFEFYLLLKYMENTLFEGIIGICTNTKHCM